MEMVSVAVSEREKLEISNPLIEKLCYSQKGLNTEEPKKEE